MVIILGNEEVVIEDGQIVSCSSPALAGELIAAMADLGIETDDTERIFTDQAIGEYLIDELGGAADDSA